jgi:hypothetical protein
MKNMQSYENEVVLLMYISTHGWSNEEIETRLARDGGIASVDVILNIRNAIGVHDRTIAPVDEFGEITSVDVLRAKWLNVDIR